MKYKSLILTAVFVLISFSSTSAKIIHVPGDSSTIQAGINGAVDGDTVLVASGTYYEHINFNGKAILVTSEVGTDSTIINKLNAAAQKDLITELEVIENLQVQYVTLQNTYDTLANIVGLKEKDRAKWVEKARIAQEKADSLNMVILKLRKHLSTIDIFGQPINKADEEYLPEFIHYDELPVPINPGLPSYPKSAKEQGIVGRVWIKALVDKNGIVTEAIIHKDSGTDAGFEQAALKHAYTIKYKPAIQDGKPIAVWVTYPVSFGL